jgi:hypothetical protein
MIVKTAAIEGNTFVNVPTTVTTDMPSITVLTASSCVIIATSEQREEVRRSCFVDYDDRTGCARTSVPCGLGRSSVPRSTAAIEAARSADSGVIVA